MDQKQKPPARPWAKQSADTREASVVASSSDSLGSVPSGAVEDRVLFGLIRCQADQDRHGRPKCT